MEIYLYAYFQKRQNSTKQPPDDDLVHRTEGVFKSPTSVINPVITIERKISGQNVYFAYTYAYLPLFKRYYFIDDVIADGELWTLSMHVDVLATYKSTISQASLYILRSSTKYNGLITDTYYPVTFERKSYITKYRTLWSLLASNPQSNIDITKGCFIIGIVSKPGTNGAGSFGSIRYYALTQPELVDFITELLDNSITNTNGFSSDDATISLQKSLINPLSYIKSCIWLPIQQGKLPGMYSNYMKVWDWQLDNVSCRVLTGNSPYYKQEQAGLDIHRHPQANARGAYLNAAPYTRISMLYPPFGMFEIDTSQIVNGGDLHMSANLDYITGLGTLDISVTVPDAETLPGSMSSVNLLQRVKAQIGVPIQLSEVSYDYTNMALTLVGGGIELIQNQFSQYLDSSIQNSLSQIGTAVNAMRTKASTIGSNGGFSELDGEAVVYEEYFIIADEDNAHLGRPLCKFLRLVEESNGYYLCRDGDVEIRGATYGELSSVKNYLEGGFFYE